MRALASAVFAAAAASVAFAGAGLVVAPHRMPVGTAALHDHPVTALRFPLLLLAEAPGPAPADELSRHHDAVRHEAHLRVAAPDGTVLVTLRTLHQIELLAAGAALALLTLAVPRLPRPTRRPLERLPDPAAPSPQWLGRLPAPPPRPILAPSA